MQPNLLALREVDLPILLLLEPQSVLYCLLWYKRPYPKVTGIVPPIRDHCRIGRLLGTHTRRHRFGDYIETGAVQTFRYEAENLHNGPSSTMVLKNQW